MPSLSASPGADLPGTRQHQVALQAIVDHYQNDPRLLEVVVFGSLGRGNWDPYSDLDLDIILQDGVEVEVRAEMEKLCASLAAAGERPALLIPDGTESGDIVCESLLQLSLRYHPLTTTKACITDSMRLLQGRMDPAIIHDAGQAHPEAPEPPLEEQLDRAVRYAAVCLVFLQRRQVWASVEVLHRLRGLLMEIFSRTHQGQRAYQTFSTQADAGLQKRLGAALPQYDQGSLRACLRQLLEMLDRDLVELSAGQLCLNAPQRTVWQRVREELDRLD